jgi:magnesium transporter
MKKRTKKTGLPPGSLVYIGDKEDQTCKITIINYDARNLQEAEKTSLDECLLLVDKSKTTWININGLQHLGTLETLGECFNLHPLILEDILNTDHRPKLEEFTDYLYVVVKMLRYNDTTQRIEHDHASFVIGANYVISLHESYDDFFGPIRERLQNAQGRLRQEGADYLAYSLLDVIVDNYFVILEQMEDNLEDIEEELISQPSPATLHKIHLLKRDLIIFRKSVWPLREVLNRLQRSETPLIRRVTQLYLKDVYDHVIHVIDSLETYRDMLSGMLDIYLSSTSNRLNEIMKVLTIIATIFIPLTYIAGVYGMNFKYMPELEWHYGYFLVLSLMAGVAGIMLLFFKRRKWL